MCLNGLRSRAPPEAPRHGDDWGGHWEASLDVPVKNQPKAAAAAAAASPGPDWQSRPLPSGSRPHSLTTVWTTVIKPDTEGSSWIRRSLEVPVSTVSDVFQPSRKETCGKRKEEGTPQHKQLQSLRLSHTFIQAESQSPHPQVELPRSPGARHSLCLGREEDLIQWRHQRDSQSEIIDCREQRPFHSKHLKRILPRASSRQTAGRGHDSILPLSSRATDPKLGRRQGRLSTSSVTEQISHRTQTPPVVLALRKLPRPTGTISTQSPSPSALGAAADKRVQGAACPHEDTEVLMSVSVHCSCLLFTRCHILPPQRQRGKSNVTIKTSVSQHFLSDELLIESSRDQSLPKRLCFSFHLPLSPSCSFILSSRVKPVNLHYTEGKRSSPLIHCHLQKQLNDHKHLQVLVSSSPRFLVSSVFTASGFRMDSSFITGGNKERSEILNSLNPGNAVLTDAVTSCRIDDRISYELQQRL
ncbi:unnamed protein product [Pleuronectes platessa]|uniref:Uncharacterized protein n=1 Tax=Pleuronectes platessa TaxID=8262 RepID=A0A9N7YD43_PLEPL|nr:unnamed protein product [Pleuronectes platessa]